MLESKDDKITLLSNYVNWLIAIAAIVVAIVTLLYGYWGRKIKESEENAKVLIQNLTEQERKITEAQTTINKIIQSGDYVRRVEEFELELKRMKEQNSAEFKKLNASIQQNYKETNTSLSEDSNQSSMPFIKDNLHTKSDIVRGDIFLANIIMSDNGRKVVRPFLIIQNDIGNKHSSFVTGIPLISNATPSPLSIPLKIEDREQFAAIPLITSIKKSDLEMHITKLDDSKLNEIEKAIAFHIGRANIDN
ncbi:type II toxin-antitoxin system PemK/MazF family toxin [Bacillus sp. V5-8f]|uniref:type II toxin-antitoxin system PemK/MazF family toxin n=1 Tax=Bacillus sp. V5-8f TaxID=2053044 RepID=UPI000C78AF5D|nr:type II toxin-antitoxin system PemK/MazF family toxin [Bacillus sp. V5-8f]PLT34098.1 hypothetical protein CUU64_07620 [Bacillus sp. V5-8f]